MTKNGFLVAAVTCGAFACAANDTTAPTSSSLRAGQTETDTAAAFPPPVVPPELTLPPVQDRSCARRTIVARSASITDLDENGAVVGYLQVAPTASHAFYWKGGDPRDLGTLGGAQSYAAAMNNRGDVVGWSERPGKAFPRAVLWRNGEIRDLGSIGGDSSEALDINDAGQIVGKAETANGETHAFVWENGVMTELQRLDGPLDSATRINAEGRVLGDASRKDARFAAVWIRGGIAPIYPPGYEEASTARTINDQGIVTLHGDNVRRRSWVFDSISGAFEEVLPIENATSTFVSNVNARGQFAVTVSYEDESHRSRQSMFFHDNGEYRPITTSVSHETVGTRAINEQGQVVGNADGSAGGRAFTWKDETFAYLASTRESSGGYHINGRGQIAGYVDDAAVIWNTEPCFQSDPNPDAGGGQAW